MLAAETPELVLDARTLWRALVWIGFLHQGRDAVGTIDVDAQSDVLLDPQQGVAAIRARATPIAAALPACRPNQQVAADYLAPDAMTAENLSLEDKA